MAAPTHQVLGCLHWFLHTRTHSGTNTRQVTHTMPKDGLFLCPDGSRMRCAATHTFPHHFLHKDPILAHVWHRRDRGDTVTVQGDAAHTWSAHSSQRSRICAKKPSAALPAAARGAPMGVSGGSTGVRWLQECPQPLQTFPVILSQHKVWGHGGALHHPTNTPPPGWGN